MTHEITGCKDCPLRKMSLEFGEAQDEYCGNPYFDDPMIDTTLPYKCTVEENQSPEWCPLTEESLILELKK